MYRICSLFSQIMEVGYLSRFRAGRLGLAGLVVQQ
jgi:hypothetical protein